MGKKIVLELSEAEAALVQRACEFYARIRVGQFGEISYYCMDVKDHDYSIRRQKADELLFESRKYIFPELHGVGHSYGIGKFEDADIAFDVHQAIRKVLNGIKPFSMRPLPICYKKDFGV